MSSTVHSGVTTTTRGEDKNSEGSTKTTLYIGIGVVGGIAVIAMIIVIFLVCNRRRKKQERHGSSKRHLITTRGFSVLEHRRGQGHIDSANEFEVYTNVQHSSRGSENSDTSPRTSAPKKPDRKRFASKSGGDSKYENVHLGLSGGPEIRKSASMDSNIPYIDRTLEKDLDDVFQPDDKSAINGRQ